ncbi:MAG: beta-galactosidase [Verrucomicrobiae bacterium]|nr:beta-galactosidase [Verrucomicrobiae bacterium]
MKSANHKFSVVIHCLILFIFSIAICFSQTAVVRFEQGFDKSILLTTDATAEVVTSGGRNVLVIKTGTNSPYPGITLKPQKPWDLSRFEFVEVRAKNVGSARATLFCRIDNPGADGVNYCLTGSSQINPGQTGSIMIYLIRYTDDRMDGKLFGMRGYPKKSGGPKTINPANIVQILFFVNKPSGVHSFEIESINAGGIHIPPTALTSDATPYFPFIDTFGQYKHKNWRGKTLSLDELKAKRIDEERELAKNEAPIGWDKWGGWANGPKLEATGFFRTQKVNGKWWLIDPDGHLFFSHGVDCVRMTEFTPIEERESWFENPPWEKSEFKEFISSSRPIKGHYIGRNVRTFSFSAANLLRKYGENWREVYPELIHKRLRSWGLNTIGNWSDERVRLMRQTPYTDNISSGRTPAIQGSEGYWGKFPDVFDPSFEPNLRRSIESKKGRSAGDPWCIGYFSDNEMSWGDEYSLALGALKSPSTQPAKIEFVRRLKEKYTDVEKLNRVWGTEYKSWDDLLQSQTTPDRARAKEDLLNFYTVLAEQYFKTVKKVIKEVAPKQLYLGCRFAWVNQLAASAAAKYCDVVSYNIYKRDVRDFKFNGGADVPLIIGEFHFGALDRGMFHTGLVPTASQEDRSKAYINYVKSVLEHPSFVGCHWFQYQDQPTTGRALDEENYQIGIVDTCDTPYSELIEAMREISKIMYK